MNKKYIVAVFAVLFFLASATFAFADGNKGKMGHEKSLDEKILFKAKMMIMNQEELALTDDQVKQIKDLKTAVKKEKIKREAEIDLLAVDIKAHLYEDKINVEAVDKLIDKKYDLKKEKAKFFVGEYAKLNGMLTEAQAKEMKSMCKKMMGGKK